MIKLDPSIVKDIVTKALEEDVGTGDITTLALVRESEEVEAEISAKEDCIIAGMPVAEAVFKQLDARVVFEPLIRDGEAASCGDRVALVKGPAGPVLEGERTALNFLQHLSGIATMTRKFVELVKDTGATILDTRKTLPGLRHLEKYAVTVGGGTNHRMGLYERVLIKDNHLRIQERYSADEIGSAVALARERNQGEPIEVEAKSLEDVEMALGARADCILLDNMTVDEIREAVALVDGRAATEASGGVSLENARKIAQTGVQYISVGCLTHSARAVDISLSVITGLM